MLDFGGPEAGLHGLLARLVHSHERLRDNAEDHVLGLMRRAGFADPRDRGHRSTLFGRTTVYAAAVPAA